MVLAREVTPVLSREDFTAKYLPRLVGRYQRNYAMSGCTLNKHGRPTEFKKCHQQAQQTKRDKRIDSDYALYLEHYKAAFRIP